MERSYAADSSAKTQTGARVVYRSYAKINLYLDVIARRDDGYHDLETVFQTVGLYDELHVEVADSELSLSCSDPSLETGASNLVYRAAALLREKAGCTQGARMHLEKRIPVAAGLAGGSGNAAAALIALNDIWNLGLGPEALAASALSLGSDVPYCLLGGAMAGTGRGELLHGIGPLPARWVVLAHPALALSTASVFAHPGLVSSPECMLDGRSLRFSDAIEKLKSGRWAEALYNRLELPVFAAHPELARIKSGLLAAGCEAALMSGSGSTVYGLCADEAEARRVAAAMAPLRCTVVQFVQRCVERQ